MSGLLHNSTVCALIAGAVLSCWTGSAAYWQDAVRISGTVIDSVAGEPMPGLNVLLMTLEEPSAQNRMAGYAFTDESGAFTIRYSGPADSLLLEISSMDIKTLRLRLRRADTSLMISVVKSPLTIREVTVQAEPFTTRSDTTTFYLSQYKAETDRSIGDVLRRLPGITVNRSGEVHFNGKAISNLYIEGMDLLGSRYGVAVNNVQASDIASVEVYERHQPVKMLEDIEYSDRTALNLKLKESAIGAWNAVLQGGGGYAPATWNAEAVGMLFAHKVQTMLSYKSNNEGDDTPARELTVFDLLGDAKKLPSLLSIRQAGNAPVNSHRYLYNNAHAASVSTLVKMSRALELNIKADYIHDVQEAASSGTTTYRINGENPISVTETVANGSRIDNLNTELTLRSNTGKHYLKETVSFDAQWLDGSGLTGGSLPTTSQSLHLRDFLVKNSLADMFRIGDHILHINSDISYQQLPSRLTVSPSSFGDLLASEPDRELDAIQKLSVSRLYTDNSISLKRYLNNWTVGASAGFSLLADRMVSSLHAADSISGLHESPDSMVNNLRYREYGIYVSPSVTRGVGRRATISIAVPLTYQIISLHEDTDGRLLIQPYARLDWKMTDLLRLWMSAGYSRSNGGIYDIYPSYVMTGYRTVTRMDETLPDYRVQNYTARLEYNDDLYGIIASVSGRYSSTKRNIITGTDIENSLISYYSIERDNSTDIWQAGASVSKRFGGIGTTVTVNGSWQQRSSEALRQEDIVGLRQNIWNAEAEVHSDIVSGRIQLDYVCSWTNTRSAFEGSRDLTVRNNIRQTLDASVSVWRGIVISAGAEHYFHDMVGSRSRNTVFLDCSVRWQTPWRLEFILSGKNLLGQKYFYYQIDDGLDTYTTEYSLRPASVTLKLRWTLR